MCLLACSLTARKVLQCKFSGVGLSFELSQKGKWFGGFPAYNPPAWEPGGPTRTEVSVFEEVVVVRVPVLMGPETLKDEKQLQLTFPTSLRHALYPTQHAELIL